MAWRFHGRASVKPSNPQAFAVCDRCGFLTNHVKLSWQFEWSGTQQRNLRLLVCKSCKDKPQEQLRTIVLPPDSLPIKDPRPQDYSDT